MKLTILGCGTSSGVPKWPEYWGACDPENPKNRRRRASVMIEEGSTRLLFDTSPDLREQMLSAKVNHLDAVFYTHDHADHVHGIDELRSLYQQTRAKIPLYGDQATMDTIMGRFNYIFESHRGYPACCSGHVIDDVTEIGDVMVHAFAQTHGSGASWGYRVGDMAYSTDVNHIPEAAFDALAGVKVWVVDALRLEPHPTHSHLDQTLAWIERVKPERAILTHMTWEMDYQTLVDSLPDGVEPAYDGMVIEC